MQDREARHDVPGAAPAAGAALATRMSALETSLEAALTDSERGPLEVGQILAETEQGVFEVLPLLEAGDPDGAMLRGHPALSEASDWRDEALHQELPDAAGRIGVLLDGLIADEIAAYRVRAAEAVGSDDPAFLFGVLAEAGALEREALDRLDTADRLTALEEPRRQVEDALARAVGAHPPSRAQRDAWAGALLDRGAVVLTGVDHLPPEQAARHLGLAASEIEWHLANIERSRGTLRRRLKRRLRRLRDEQTERDLMSRLEDRYGTRRVAIMERLVLWLIFFVLAVLFIEFTMDLSPTTVMVLAVLDALACSIFLAEFFTKLRLVRGKRRWFLRHFLIDFVPSIPFNILTLVLLGGAVHADPTRAARVLRLARLTRVARYLRLLMPIIRMVRAAGFLARGLDRLARRYGYLLNRNIVLYPTRVERAQAAREHHSLIRRARALRGRVSEEWTDLLRRTPGELRSVVADLRTAVLERARGSGLTSRPSCRRRQGTIIEDLPAEDLIRRLDEVSSTALESGLGQDFVSRAARAIRLFARPPIRWFPVIRRFVPKLAPEMSEADIVTAACHQGARELQRQHERWFWFADLYGTVTPSEFVDRVGSTMVKSAFRPAYRLTLFGGFFLIVQVLLDLIGRNTPFLQTIHGFLDRFVGIPLVVLGSICVVVLGLGWWLKRLAGEATIFYEQAARAQFLALTECVKGRYVERDTRLLDRRIFEPEERARGVVRQAGHDEQRGAFLETVKRWLVEAHVSSSEGGLTYAHERVVLLYRDNLDGALLGESDTRTTSQLLGNPALRQLRALSERVSKREQKALRTLDLDRPRASIRGPYLWFSYIAKAITHGAARLIVEYNENAIPLDELPLLRDADRSRYETWLGQRRESSERSRREPDDDSQTGYVTTAFTALHFLDDDPTRDDEVADRFGPKVLEKLQADRCYIFRKVFGTYPLHMRPREQRVLNIYRTYERWLSGGRAFLIPLRILWRGVKVLGRFGAWIRRAIRELRNPSLRSGADASQHAEFKSALRKINRMRGPIVWATLWIRARFDVEYLGLRVPGMPQNTLRDRDVHEDLRFLGADAEQVRAIEEERERADWDLRRLARMRSEGLMVRIAEILDVPLAELDTEHARAAAAAYHADFSGVRALLSCHEILVETRVEARGRPILPLRWWPYFRLRGSFKRWWREHGRGDKEVRKAMWRAVIHDVGEARRALEIWDSIGPDAAHERGVALMADLLRHPGRVSEQLVTLRAVQTLSLIDLLNYRDHVYRLGRYEELGDVPGESLVLDGVGPTVFS